MRQNINMYQQLNDSQLAQVCASTLNDSLNDIDQISLQRLKNARALALSQPKNNKNKWVGFGVAAGLILFVALPITLTSKHFIVEGDVETLTQEAPISEQEMDDIEMLMSLGETDA